MWGCCITQEAQPGDLWWPRGVGWEEGGRFKEGIYVYLCMCDESPQLFLILCNSMNYYPPGSSVHGILQARILGWVAMPSSRESSRPRDWTHVSSGSCLAGRFFTAEPPGKTSYIAHDCKIESYPQRKPITADFQSFSRRELSAFLKRWREWQPASFV